MESSVPVIELDGEKPVITLDECDDECNSDIVPVVTLEDDIANEPPLISLDDDKSQIDLDVTDDPNIEDSLDEEIICDGTSKYPLIIDNLENSHNVITLDDSDHLVPETEEPTLPSTSVSEDVEIDVILSEDRLKSISNSSKKLHECKKCHKMFPNIHKLNNHSCTISKKQFQCSICNEVFFDKHELSTHAKAHSGGKPYICDICFKNFSDKNILRMHYNTHTGEKPFACTICDKVFPNTLALKNHYQMHIGEKPYVCDVCLASFDHKSSLCNHKLEEHQFLTVI